MDLSVVLNVASMQEKSEIAAIPIQENAKAPQGPLRDTVFYSIHGVSTLNECLQSEVRGKIGKTAHIANEAIFSRIRNRLTKRQCIPFRTAFHGAIPKYKSATTRRVWLIEKKFDAKRSSSLGHV